MLISGCIIREPSFSFKGLIIKTSLLPKCYQQQCKKRTFSPIEVRMTLYEGSAITSKTRLQKLITTLQAIAVRSGKRVCDTGETGPHPNLCPNTAKLAACCALVQQKHTKILPYTTILLAGGSSSDLVVGQKLVLLVIVF